MNSIDKTLVFLSIITGRILYFITNLQEFFVVLTFSMFLYDFFGLLQISFEKTIVGLLFTSISMHFLYFGVYTVNDIVDYPEVVNFDESKYDGVDYRYRPIIFFKRNKNATILMLIWYLFCVYAVSFLYKSYTLQVFSVSIFFTVLSFVRSISKGRMRFFFLGVQRYSKYICLVVLLNLFLFENIYNEVTGLIILSLVVPYTTYVMIGFSGKLVEYVLLKKRRSLFVSFSLLALLFVSFFIQSTYSISEVVWSFMLGYATVAIPGNLIKISPNFLVFKGKKEITVKEKMLVRTVTLFIIFVWCTVILLFLCFAKR